MGHIEFLEKIGQQVKSQKKPCIFSPVLFSLMISRTSMKMDKKRGHQVKSYKNLMCALEATFSVQYSWKDGH